MTGENTDLTDRVQQQANNGTFLNVVGRPIEGDFYFKSPRLQRDSNFGNRV